MNQFDVKKKWAKSSTVLVPTFWRLAKLSPLLPFHDGHKVLCLDICIGNIIRLYRSNILPRNKGWTAKIRTSYQFNFPAKLLQFMIHYFFKLWLLWSTKKVIYSSDQNLNYWIICFSGHIFVNKIQKRGAEFWTEK